MKGLVKKMKYESKIMKLSAPYVPFHWYEFSKTTTFCLHKPLFCNSDLRKLHLQKDKIRQARYWYCLVVNQPKQKLTHLSF